MAVTIGDGNLALGGAVVETSGGTKYAVFYAANVVEVWKDIDSVPSLEDSDTAATVHGGDNIDWVHAAIDSGDDIHIVCACSAEQTRDISYAIYDTGTDTIGAWEEAVSYEDAAPVFPGVSIGIDSSDKPHVLYVDRVTSKGSTQDEIYYTNKVSGWAAKGQVSFRPDKADSYNRPRISLCPNDDIEAFYAFYTDSDVAYRRKNADWGAESVYVESPAYIGVVVVTSGDTVYRYHADGDRDIEENDVDTTYNAYSGSAFVTAALDGTDRYVFYIDTNRDIHVISNDGGGWTDEGAQQVGTYVRVIAEWAYNNENQSGEINYIFDDGTNVYYDSFSLGAFEPFPPVPGRVHKDYRNVLLRM